MSDTIDYFCRPKRSGKVYEQMQAIAKIKPESIRIIEIDERIAAYVKQQELDKAKIEALRDALEEIRKIAQGCLDRGVGYQRNVHQLVIAALKG